MQMLQVIGLGDEGRGAGTHAPVLEKLRLLGREDHDPARHLTGLDPGQHIQPVEGRNVQVQHHQFRPVLTDHRQHFVTAGRFINALVPLLLEYDFECAANHRVIVHYQH